MGSWQFPNSMQPSSQTQVCPLACSQWLKAQEVCIIPAQSPLKLPYQHFLVYTLGLKVGGCRFTLSPTYLLGFTISFVVIGSPQLHAEQPLKTAGPAQNTCEFPSLIIFPCLCQFVFFEVQSKSHSPVSPLMCPEPDVPLETLLAHVICM